MGIFDKFPSTKLNDINLDWILKKIRALRGGSTNQVLAKASDADFDFKWITGGGGGGTSDYNDLVNQPQINGVTLVGNQSAADLGLLGTAALTSYRTAAAQDAIDATKQAKITASGMLKGDGNGGVTAATAGSDYLAPAALTPYRTATAQDAIDATKQAKITASGMLKGDGNGGVTAATAGTDYLAPAALNHYRTAAAQDVIDAAQNADIASRAKADEIGIVITGARPSMAVTAGQYVIVRGSTITGITDGLYKAINALSPSTDVSAADLTAAGGGLNDLQGAFNSRFLPGTLSDLNELGTSARPLLFAIYDAQTLNTPYKEGITAFTAGTVFHISSSSNYSCQMVLCAGDASIYMRRRNINGWGSWTKITAV